MPVSSAVRATFGTTEHGERGIGGRKGHQQQYRLTQHDIVVNTMKAEERDRDSFDGANVMVKPPLGKELECALVHASLHQFSCA